jgi:hypothetical protein
MGKYRVKILYPKNIFVNFRPHGDNILTHFYINMDYSDTLINFEYRNGQDRKPWNPWTFAVSAGPVYNLQRWEPGLPVSNGHLVDRHQVSLEDKLSTIFKAQLCQELYSLSYQVYGGQ